MVIATVRGRDEVDGCLVGFSTQCSIDPTRFLVCLSKANRTYQLALESSMIVVNMLHDSARDQELARLFGEETAFETAKFDKCDWERGPDGVPVLATCDWFAGRIVDHVELGDHVGFVLAVFDGRALRTDERYLGFRAVCDFDAGNPP